MRSVYEARVAEATETERRIRQGDDKIVVRKFGKVAKLLWPFNTSAHVATIAKCSTRQADRYLSGEYEPPYSVVEATMHAIFSSED